MAKRTKQPEIDPIEHLGALHMMAKLFNTMAGNVAMAISARTSEGSKSTPVLIFSANFNLTENEAKHLAEVARSINDEHIYVAINGGFHTRRGGASSYTINILSVHPQYADKYKLCLMRQLDNIKNIIDTMDALKDKMCSSRRLLPILVLTVTPGGDEQGCGQDIANLVRIMKLAQSSVELVGYNVNTTNILRNIGVDTLYGIPYHEFLDNVCWCIASHIYDIAHPDRSRNTKAASEALYTAIRNYPLTNVCSRQLEKSVIDGLITLAGPKNGRLDLNVVYRVIYNLLTNGPIFGRIYGTIIGHAIIHGSKMLDESSDGSIDIHTLVWNAVKRTNAYIDRKHRRRSLKNA